MFTGIYQIRNLVNNKIYIGSAKDIVRRWDVHKHKLSKGKHHSKHLQCSYNKYGLQNFTFEIIEQCSLNKDVLLSLEQKYLDSLHPQYNMSKVTGSPLGFKHTKETRDRMSLSRKGVIVSEETKQKISILHKGRKHTLQSKLNMSKAQKVSSRKSWYKPVQQICPNSFSVLNEYISVKDAGVSCNIRPTCISGVLNGRQRTAGGYLWKYNLINNQSLIN